MKKIIYFILLIALVVSCTTEMTQINLPDPITKESVTVTITPDDVQNVYNVAVTVPEDAIVKIDFGNGSKADGKTGQAAYPFKGKYYLNIGIATKGGVLSLKDSIIVTTDNFELVKDPVYLLLTGGVDAANGKTWVLDSLSAGHLSCGPIENYDPQWWSARPIQKTGKRIYDDEITFVLKGAKVILDNKGQTYVNGSAKDAMISRGATLMEREILYPGEKGADWVATYKTTGEGPDFNWTWFITKEGEKTYINFPDRQAFFIYYVGATNEKYEIISITENELYVRIQLPAIAWYYKLITKGYVR